MKRIGLLVLVGLLFCAAALRDAGDRWVDRTVLPATLSDVSTEIRDRNGTMLRVYPVESGIWRLETGPDAVDRTFLDMLVRYEDKRFWRHGGVDPRALLRASGQALWHGRVVSGGSTLTMQVARLLENGGTGRWSGKLRQIRVALALERRLSKQQILGLYLTHAPYGGNLEGVRAASLAWFGKEPRRLTAGQAALLVALPQSPQGRRPDRYPDAAAAARSRVIGRALSQGILNAEEAGTAAQVALPKAMNPFPRLAAHLTDRARAARPLARRVTLTLDAAVQESAETLLRRAVRQGDARLSAALVAADIRTGAIVASVGSPAYGASGGRQGFVDMTRAIRSPGSTLKPLVYGLAFDQGIVHPETLIQDSPVQFGRYAPQNFDGRFRGDVRVRDALQQSLNIPVVRLTQELGPPRLMAALARSGADVRLPGNGAPGLAVALGGVGISLHDLVQLYAGLARSGHGPGLHAGTGERTAEPGRLMSEVAAWQVGNILAGLTPPPEAPAGVLAYKTGTSYGHRDTWAVGFDGQHVIGVWMGRADGTPVPGAFGGDLAAPVLFEAFGLMKPDFEPLPPPPPATLILTSAELPQPLRRFRPRGSAFSHDARAPQVTFPPDGARLAVPDGALTIKLRGGTAPFTLLADGHPVAVGQRQREFAIPNPGPGFSTLVVLDSDGLSDRVGVRLD